MPPEFVLDPVGLVFETVSTGVALPPGTAIPPPPPPPDKKILQSDFSIYIASLGQLIAFAFIDLYFVYGTYRRNQVPRLEEAAYA